MWVWDMAVGEIEGSGDGETFEAHVINTQVFFLFFVFFFLAVPHGIWDLSSQPEMEPMLPAVEAQSLNHWTAREVPTQKCF